MSQDTNKLIVEHILKKNNLHNQKNSKGYTATIEGKVVRPSNVNELAEKLYAYVAQNELDKQWYADINKEVVNEAHNTNKGIKEIWLNRLVVAINGYLSAKAEYRDAHTELSIASAFESSKFPLGFLPEDDVNSTDIALIDGVVYCERDDLFYFKDNNTYTLLGDINELTTKGSVGLRKLFGLLADKFQRNTGKEFHFWHEMYEICNNATKDFISARRQIDELIKQGNKDSKQMIDVFGNKVEIYKVLQIFEVDQIPNEWANKLCNFYAKYLINSKLPAIIFNRKLCTLNYECEDQEGAYFKRFALTFPQSGKVPMNDYLVKLFEFHDIVIRNIPHIETIPHIISDDSTPSKYYLNEEWKNNLVPGQYELKDCKILNTFLHPYTTEEKLALMAWAYTVLHPSYGDTINMLFKTGGGTFKTNYYSAMIQQLLCKMYNVKNNDCSYVMSKDNWVKDRFLLEGKNGGVSMAAFVNNDECTMNSIEEFKNFSGGGKNGMDYSKRTMRTEPTQMKIYSKWLFTTNNDFLINDDSGAYDRRLFIIDRMDVKKLQAPYAKANYDAEVVKEMKTFYEVAESSYKQILKTHKSLEDYVTDPKISISRNLKKAYAEEDKIFVYYKIFEKYNATDVLEIPCKDFTETAKLLCEENEVNFNGFKNWIRATDKTEYPCKWQTNKWVNKQRVRHNILYKLKPEFEPKCEEDTDMYSINSVCV